MSTGIDLAGSQVLNRFIPALGGGSGSGSTGSAVLGAIGMANPWIAVGTTLLSGMLSQKDQSGANAAGGASQLNTSGWVVGEGDATGGALSTVPTIPWYVWVIAIGGVVYVARKKRGI